jgi:hypothetical protein
MIIERTTSTHPTRRTKHESVLTRTAIKPCRVKERRIFVCNCHFVISRCHGDCWVLYYLVLRLGGGRLVKHVNFLLLLSGA